MNRFLTAAGFLSFFVPFFGLGLMWTISLLSEGKWLAGLLTFVAWSATGIVLGKNAASGFSKHTLLTAGIALLCAFIDIRIVNHLQDQGSRSLSELMLSSYMFFFLLWALIATPVAITRGVRRAWAQRQHHNTRRYFAMSIPVCGALVAFIAYACWYFDAPLQTALSVIGSAIVLFGLYLVFYYFAFRREPTR